MAQLQLEVGALNIVASPHPPGVYRELLSAIANKEVQLWGSDRAKITHFQEFEDKPDLLYGRVLVWAEIDTEGKWINKKKNVEATPEEKQIIAEAIPEDYEPNFRSFSYIFVEKKHRLIIETRNELGQHLAPSRAERMFQRLFDRHLAEDAPSVDVTVIPEDESLEKILAIPKLRRFEIFIKRPNPDDVTVDAERVLARLERQNARSHRLELTKAPKKKSLSPDSETKKLAEVAAAGNGYVTGEGRDASGRRIVESTEKHPKIKTVEVGGTSSFAAFLSALRFF